MKTKMSALVLVFVLLVGTGSGIALASYSPPTGVGAPLNVAVVYREDGFEKTWSGFDVNVSASDELRSFVDVIGADPSDFVTSGYSGFELMAQLDYRMDDGKWHHTGLWDEDRGYNTNKSLCNIEKGTYTASVVFDKSQIESISGSETLPVDKTFFDTHVMHVRVRFLVNYQDEDGTYFGFFSPWSEPVSYQNNQQVEDPAALLNHIPVLSAVALATYEDGTPYLDIRAGKAHEDTQLLNNLSNGWVKSEVWLRVNNGEWKASHSANFEEQFQIGAQAYFGLKDSYEAAVYEVKFRYSFDYLNYPAAGKSGVIYSPFSNTISHGMSAYSTASGWAKPELDKAAGYGLIPDSLKGADMTKPITREEFAELAVLLHEKSTGTTGASATANPFRDTTNPQVLKAYQLKIVEGTSGTTFAPKALTNREQVATMLSRTLRGIAPNGDFSTVGSPVFHDQKEISSWAMAHVLYMAKMEIIKGSDGLFMPKAVTTSQTAAGYATTTREQAIAMSVRSFDRMDEIQSVKPAATSADLVGIWEHMAASGNTSLYISLELNRDGTFIKTVGTATSFSVSGTGFSGEYTISGDKLLFTNRKKGTTAGSSLTDMLFTPDVEDMPVEDAQESFVLVDAHQLRLGDTAFVRR